MNDLRGVLRGLAPDDDERTPLANSFLRGLTLGALAGAVLAGSAVLQRRHRSGGSPDPVRSAGAGPPAGDAPHPGDAIGAEPGGADGPGDRGAGAEPQALGRS